MRFRVAMGGLVFCVSWVVPCIALCDALGAVSTEVVPAQSDSAGASDSNETTDDSATRGGKRKKQPDSPTDTLVVPSDVLPDDRIVLPKSDQPTPPIAASFVAKKVVLHGNTKLDDATVGNIVAPFLNRNVSYEDLTAIRHALSRAYVDRGYINSGVVLPNQKVEDGVVVFEAVEGRLTSIDVEGARRLSVSRLKDRILANTTAVLNIAELRDALRLLQQDPLIEKVNAQLSPGARPGESILRLAVAEAPSWVFVIGADNHRSPSVGSEEIFISAGQRNLTGVADSLMVSGGISDGFKNGDLTYELPLNGSGTTVRLEGAYDHAVVVEPPFDQIDIVSEQTKYSIALAHPIVRSVDTTLKGSIAFEKKHSKSELLDQPFSFSLGSDQGEEDVSVIDLAAEWVTRTASRVTYLRGAFRKGLSAFGATKNDGDTPDGEFSSLQGQGQYASTIDLMRSQAFARIAMQVTGDTLLSLEKFAIGGSGTVRGYRENALIRDNGFAASIEWRIPILFSAGSSPSVFVVPFYDYGRVWDSDEELTRTKSESLSSVGIGTTLNTRDGFNADLYWGYALDDAPKHAKEDLQDKGIHFRVYYQTAI